MTDRIPFSTAANCLRTIERENGGRHNPRTYSGCQYQILRHLFIQFLAHHDALDEWLTEIIKRNDEAGLSDRFGWVADRGSADFIREALRYDRTARGPEYWEPLNREWINIRAIARQEMRK